MDATTCSCGGGFAKAKSLQDDSEALAICQLPDSKLARHIADKLPQGTYTSIWVTTIRSTFSGALKEKIIARKVILTLTRVQNIGAFFRSFFAGFGMLAQTEDYEHELDEKKLETQLVSSIFQGKKEHDEIRRAYTQATAIKLRIAQDLSRIDMKLDRSVFVLHTYTAGKSVRCIGETVMVAVQLWFAIKSGEKKASNTEKTAV